MTSHLHGEQDLLCNESVIRQRTKHTAYKNNITLYKNIEAEICELRLFKRIYYYMLKICKIQ